MFVKLTDKDGVKLQTRDTLCAEDINVFPNLQSIEATENGTYTVEDGYAGIGEVKVNVSIPDGDVPEGEIPEGYVKPEGEIVITSNGTHDVAGKKTAVVRVPIEGAMNINGVIKQYKVNAGASVSAGDFVEFVNKYGSGYFGSTTPIYLRACKVSERTVLAVYTYSGVLYGVVFEIGEDGYVSVGDQKVISKSSSGPLALSVLSDNTALLDDGASSVFVLKVSDGTVSVLSSTATTSSYGTIALNKNIAIGSDYSTGTAGTNQSEYILIFEIDEEGLISTPKRVDVNGYAIIASEGLRLTDKKALFTAMRYNASSYDSLYVFAVAYDDGTVSRGNEITLSSYGVKNSVSLAALTAEEVLVAVTEYNSNTGGTGGGFYLTNVYLFYVGGVKCNLLASETIQTRSTSCAVCALSSNKAVVVYDEEQYEKCTFARVLKIDADASASDAITMGDAVEIDNYDISDVDVTALSESSVLVTYNRQGAGKYKTLTIDDMTITVEDDGQTGGTFVQPATSTLHNVGVARSAGAAGETVEVYCVQ